MNFQIKTKMINYYQVRLVEIVVTKNQKQNSGVNLNVDADLDAGVRHYFSLNFLKAN